MDPIFAGLVVLGMLLLILGTGVWIFSTLLIVASLSLYFIKGSAILPIGSNLSSVMLTGAMKAELAAIPLFIFMGDLIFRSDISDRIFRGLRPLIGGAPGGLLHSNVLGCTMFAAVSGSSTATTATVGKITLPMLQQYGYNRATAIGSLAGSGSLGLLIPPSIMLIIYGVLAEANIVKLFMAGIVPGLLIAGLFSLYIAYRHFMNRAETPRVETGESLSQRLWQVLDLWPIIFLMAIIFIGLYTIATPSETAALAVAATFLVLAILRQLNFKMIIESAMSSVTTSCSICIILIAAGFLSSSIAQLHLPQNIAEGISSLNAHPYMLMAMLALFFIILGFFLDGISIVVMTLPITIGIVTAAGFDPVWYGIFLVIMVEAGLITPPLGFNLFVIQSLTGEKIGMIAWSAIPFFLLMLLATALLVVFPDIVLFLPELLSSSNG